MSTLRLRSGRLAIVKATAFDRPTSRLSSSASKIVMKTLGSCDFSVGFTFSMVDVDCVEKLFSGAHSGCDAHGLDGYDAMKHILSN